MKSVLSLLLFLGSTATLTVSALAADPAANPPITPAANPSAQPAPTPERKMVEVECQFIRTTDAVMRKALKTPGQNFSPSIALTQQQVDEATAILRAEKADFFSAPRGVTMSGMRAVVESVREFRYPTEFEKSADQPGKFFAKVFETRNVGVTIEFEALVRSNGRIDLTMAPSVTDFLGFVDYSAGKPAHDPAKPDAVADTLKEPLKEGGLWQPIFSSQKTMTQFALDPGQTILVACIPKPGSEIPRTEKKDPEQTFVFITASVISQ